MHFNGMRSRGMRVGSKTLSNCSSGHARVFKLMAHISCQIAVNV